MKPKAKSQIVPDRIAFYPHPGTMLIFPLLSASYFLQIANQIHDASKHREHGGYWLSGSIGLIYVIGFALSLYAFFLQCGSVDRDGIRWRNRKGSYLTRWDEVADFYQTIGGSFVIETERNKITVGAGVVHAEPVRDFITARCGERLGLTAWELCGLRPRDFPQTFGYSMKICERNTRGGRVMLWIAPLFLVGGITSALLFSSLAGCQISIGVALLAISSAIGLGGLRLVRAADATRPRAGQKFTAQADGFTYDTGREAVFVAWSDVIGYDFSPKNGDRLFPALDALRLRTEQGQEFNFLGMLDRVELWKETVRRLATNGIETKIDAERGQALGGVEHCWSGGVEGVGDRVFHARTRNNFSLPLFFGALTLILFSLTVCDLATWIDLPRIALLPVSVFAIILEVFFAKDYLTRRVTIGADDISYVTIENVIMERQKRISWREVTDWKADFRGIRIDATDGTRIRFKPSGLAYGSRIAPLIEEHLRDAGVTAGAKATAANASDVSAAATTLPTAAR